MTASPQLECPACRFPVLLAFVERDGDERRLRCPVCSRAETWVVRPAGEVFPERR